MPTIWPDFAQLKSVSKLCELTVTSCQMSINNHMHARTHAHTFHGSLDFVRDNPGASTRRNIHPLTPIVVINHPLSASFIYYNPWHPLCSIYVPDGLFPQSLSKFYLVYLLAWHPPLHTPYISSPNLCLLHKQILSLSSVFCFRAGSGYPNGYPVLGNSRGGFPLPSSQFVIAYCDQSFPSPCYCLSAAPSLSSATLLSTLEGIPYLQPGNAGGYRSAPAICQSLTSIDPTRYVL